ncbi:FAD-dependent monooxygenase [Actinoplanes sp. HUAS TT8]|uniref:FAD-dependent monooxygenase n=1 Tax=Actinoplanes sp. HUAS TT8 TaxID=3447453 RepID=UPI003F524199
MLRILIAGAGIAGLALKHLLAQRGIEADLVERDPAPRAGGTGLYLPANAVRALRDVGVEAALIRRAQPVHQQEIRDVGGELLTEFPLTDIWGEVGASYAIRRADLHAILLDAVGPGQVRFGTPFGSTDGYDVVVGADGIDSAVRRSEFPLSRKHFLGQVCWRFLTPSDSVPAGTWTARLGDHGRTFLTVPVGDGEVYCFAAVNSRTEQAPDGDWRDLFREFGGPVPELPADPRDAHFAPLHELRGDDWVRGNVVLIGDAAHACSPSMAQGGAMALEDAVVLASLLAEAPDRAAVPAVLENYRVRRAARIRFVLEQNHRRDRARNLPGLVRKVAFRRFGPAIIKGNHAALLSHPLSSESRRRGTRPETDV